MGATYLEDLKKLLTDYYESCQKIRAEIASGDEQDAHDYDVAWEISSMKTALIGLVGREMVRSELGVESKIEQLAPARSALFDFIEQHNAEISLDELQDAISECWASPSPPVSGIEVKTLHLVTEATAIRGEQEGNKFPFLLIAEGLSKNRRLYTREALKDGAHLFNDVPIYMDHPDGVHEGRPSMRTFENKVGWWSDAKFVNGTKQHPAGIIATANIFESTAYPWVAGRIRESVESGRPDLVGVSIYADIEAQPVRDNEHGVIYKVLKFTNARSVDLVAEPAAGGRALVTAESIMEVVPVGEETQESKVISLTEDKLRELVESAARTAVAEVRKEPDEPPDPPPDEPGEPGDDPEVRARMKAFEAAMTTINDSAARLAEREAKMDQRDSRDRLNKALTTAKLPPGVIEIALGESEDAILSDEDVAGVVKRYQEVAREGFDDAIRKLPPTQRSQFISPTDQMITPVERVQNALDIFFDVEVSEDVRNNTPKIISFRQFYGQVTGDWAVDGYYHPEESIIGNWLGRPVAEALPTQAKFIGGATITMGNLFGTSMNRRLLQVYKAQTRWWEPIATQTDLANFKQQDRIRTDNYGPLTNRPVGTEEYIELTWGEKVESYVPSGWGNIVSVNRRAVINDDLNGIRRQPVLLARAAVVTINEYVAALLTTAAGVGVNMADGNPVFHLSRGNVGALPLTYANLLTARTAGMAIVDNAGNRLLNQYRYMLVPWSLSDAAWAMVNSNGVPGSPNNDPNVLNNPERGMRGVITVPNFDDSNDWYMSVDPDEALMTPIEVGFINGQREPELFIQDGPTEGMVFTHDGIYYKVRFEFGADVIDAIGLYGNIVTGA